MNALCRSILACAAVASGVAGLAQRATADDFRIETKMFVGKETEPASENLTLFRGSEVYDFLDKPSEITLFDRPRGRVILIDPVRRVKTEVKIERLTAFSDDLKTWCGRQSDPLLKFASEAKFDETLDESTGEMLFSSQFLTYRVQTIRADNEAIARQYREFSDYYARLNALTNPGAMPPFPRLAVNEALFRSRMIPEKVQLTIPSRSHFGGKPTTMRTEHAVNWRLLQTDLQKIDEAAEYLVTFTPLPLEKYLQVDSHETHR
jgi:hypothetical protein